MSAIPKISMPYEVVSGVVWILRLQIRKMVPPFTPIVPTRDVLTNVLLLLMLDFVFSISFLKVIISARDKQVNLTKLSGLCFS